MDEDDIQQVEEQVEKFRGQNRPERKTVAELKVEMLRSNCAPKVAEEASGAATSTHRRWLKHRSPAIFNSFLRLI